MSEDKIFADGFFFKKKDQAPDFVVGKMSIKVEEAVVFLKANVKTGWVNLDIKQSKSGKYYFELDTWVAKPKNDTPAAAPPVEAQAQEDLPF